MKSSTKWARSSIWIMFVLGLWLVVIWPLGKDFDRMPGGLIDTRYINYVLEHFFRWLNGLDKSFWSATFFFPYPNVIAFSENFLGSAPVYSLLRLIGLNRASAFQVWYILGYCFNFLSASYVLSKLKFKYLAVGMGAFFFTFGLPILAQENHAQLLYRFCVPMACFFLWSFAEEPQLRKLVLLVFWIVWQFYLDIYIGVFLGLLITSMIFLFSVFESAKSRKGIFIWFVLFKKGWSQARFLEQMTSVVLIITLGLALTVLLFPYFETEKLYGFSRSLTEISTMLPRPQSYLMADNSVLWKSIGNILPNVPMRHEHQLFPGVTASMLLIIGIIGKFPMRSNSKMIWSHLGSVILLVMLTLYINGYSLYKVMLFVPGMNSIRAISRIQLVLMWPIGVFIAYVVDNLLSIFSNTKFSWATLLLYLMAGCLIAESTFYNHSTFSKADADARLTLIRKQLPASQVDTPILLVANQEINQDESQEIELDAMLVAQDLGWPTLNGYSGNFPPNFKPISNCSEATERITQYMVFARITNQAFYEDMIKHIIPVGLSHCVLN